MYIQEKLFLFMKSLFKPLPLSPSLSLIILIQALFLPFLKTINSSPTSVTTSVPHTTPIWSHQFQLQLRPALRNTKQNKNKQILKIRPLTLLYPLQFLTLQPESFII